jgi:hypothetical protein
LEQAELPQIRRRKTIFGVYIIVQTLDAQGIYSSTIHGWISRELEGDYPQSLGLNWSLIMEQHRSFSRPSRPSRSHHESAKFFFDRMDITVNANMCLLLNGLCFGSDKQPRDESKDSLLENIQVFFAVWLTKLGVAAQKFNAAVKFSERTASTAYNGMNPRYYITY